MDNKYELVFNERDDAAELKNLPIDDTMHGIIEEEELEDEGSDDEDDNGDNQWNRLRHVPIQTPHSSNFKVKSNLWIERASASPPKITHSLFKRTNLPTQQTYWSSRATFQQEGNLP